VRPFRALLILANFHTSFLSDNCGTTYNLRALHSISCELQTKVEQYLNKIERASHKFTNHKFTIVCAVNIEKKRQYADNLKIYNTKCSREFLIFNVINKKIFLNIYNIYTYIHTHIYIYIYIYIYIHI